MSWRERIEVAVDAASWPLALSDLAVRSGGIPQETIADYLEERYGAVIEHGVVMQLERLGAAERLIYVLRDARSALHTSQIRARHHKLFGGDISENAIGGTLARLKEALIVERGTYDLYENLDLSPEKIATIRDQVHAYLDSKGEVHLNQGHSGGPVPHSVTGAQCNSVALRASRPCPGAGTRLSCPMRE